MYKNIVFLIRFLVVSFICWSDLNASETSKLEAHELQAKRLLCVSKGWEKYISCEFFELHGELEKLGWSKIEIDENNDEATLQAISNTEVVCLFEGYEFVKRNKDSLINNVLYSSKRKVFYCDDVHCFTDQYREVRLAAYNWADLIIATYPEKLMEYFPEVSREKIRWAPHAAASCFDTEFNPSSKKILLSGTINWVYPFRQLCQQVIPQDICEILEHPGYPSYPGNTRMVSSIKPELMADRGREHYGKILRTYPAMLVCGSMLKYLVAKVFEGMSSGCLMICDRESLGAQLTKLGFKENVHYIGTDILHAKEDAIKVSEMINTQPERWKSIVENAYKKVKSEHVVSVRAKQVNNAVLWSLPNF